MSVNIHNLDAVTVVALELDLLAYQARCRADLLRQGSQTSYVPRTRFGWLLAHFKDAANSRNNAISKATANFNRRRGVPVDSVLFKSPNQYAKCLASIELNDAGEIMYRGASDHVWKQIRK